MTSPRLQMLQRQLSQAGVNAPSGESNLSSKFWNTLQSVVEEEADVKIKAAKEQQQKAESQTAELRKEISGLRKELEQAQKDAKNQISTLHVTFQQERERCEKAYRSEMQLLQNKLTALRQELAGEQQARVRAETETQAAGKMQAHLEKMIATMKPVQAAPTQVTMPPATPMKPVTMRVSQRDANGHILAISIAPTT